MTGGAALLVNPKDPADIARALIGLLDDEHARRELSDAGLRRAADFSWERTARTTLDVYGEAMKRRMKDEDRRGEGETG